MLHERNDEVAQYFTEGQDAAFFDGVEELVSRIRHYLDHAAERKTVAAAGLRRSLESDYSIDRRMREAIAFIEDRMG